jgi:hypothetical protein
LCRGWYQETIAREMIMKQVMRWTICVFVVGWMVYSTTAEKRSNRKVHVKISSNDQGSLKLDTSKRERESKKKLSAEAKRAEKKGAIFREMKKNEEKRKEQRVASIVSYRKSKSVPEKKEKLTVVKNSPARSVSHHSSEKWIKGNPRERMADKLRKNELNEMMKFKEIYNIDSDLWEKWMVSLAAYKDDFIERIYKGTYECTHDNRCKKLVAMTKKTLKKNGINPNGVSILVEDLNTSPGMSLIAVTHSPKCELKATTDEKGRITDVEVGDVVEPARIIFDKSCVENLEQTGLFGLAKSFIIKHEVKHLTELHHSSSQFIRALLSGTFKHRAPDHENITKLWQARQEETAEFMTSLYSYKDARIMLEMYKVLMSKSAVETSSIHPSVLKCFRTFEKIIKMWEKEIPKQDIEELEINQKRKITKLYMTSGHCTRAGVPGFPKDLEPAVIVGNLDMNEENGKILDKRTCLATMTSFPNF